jgi:stress response protein YsnF
MPVPFRTPPTEAGTAFQDRVIEVRATGEAVVITKEVRAVEEIVVRKRAADRVETVRETLRESKVEIEDTTAAPAPSSLP